MELVNNVRNSRTNRSLRDSACTNAEVSSTFRKLGACVDQRVARYRNARQSVIAVTSVDNCAKKPIGACRSVATSAASITFAFLAIYLFNQLLHRCSTVDRHSVSGSSSEESSEFTAKINVDFSTL